MARRRAAAAEQVSTEQVAVVMYATRTCGYCARARALLTRKGVPFTEIEAVSGSAAREEALQRTGRTSVPQIFVGERHIGGFDDLAALDASGELDRILADAKNA
jgi:GrxC family glutaredoxin